MLALAYVVMAVMGCGYIVVAVFMGHLSDAPDGSHGGHEAVDSSYGVDGGGHGHASTGASAASGFHFPLFSPLALSTLCASVGGYGLIAKFGFEASDAGSLLAAVPAALSTAYVVTYMAWRIVLSSRGSSQIRTAELAGCRGEILTPIPEGGVGEVAVMVGGQRYTGPAREPAGRPIPRGSPIVVESMVGATLVVRKLEAGEGSNA